MQRIQQNLFIKDYQQLQKTVKSVSIKQQLSEEALLLTIAQSKLRIYNSAIRKQSFIETITQQYQICENINKKFIAVPAMIRNIYVQSFRHFIFQLLPENNDIIEQQRLIDNLLKLDTMVFYLKNDEIMKRIRKSLYLSISLLQLQTRRLIAINKNQWAQEIEAILQFTLELDNKQIHSICKKIIMIMTHLTVNCYNSLTKIDSITCVEHFLQYLDKYTYGKKKYLSDHSMVVLVYNCVKILLGFDKIPELLIQPLKKFVRHFKYSFSQKYGDCIIQLFFIIKSIIFKKQDPINVQKNMKGKNGMIKKEQQLSSDESEQEGNQNKFLTQRLSNFLNINLDTIVVQLDQVAQNIIRHRVASLATLICYKLGLNKFSKYFIEIMHDSPFNNDIQTIKLCFQLFEARQFNKLQHLFQIVLSAPGCKNLKQREVLIAMCGIFTGLYLQNRQSGLLYAKLNLLECKNTILKPQTLYQHVGFAYYNLAIHEKYLENKQVYLIQALSNFQTSYKINPNNYLLTYCMGKLYLILHDLQSAYVYATESCKSSRGSWMPFALLACIYMCQRRIAKAAILIDQLIKKYQDSVQLRYFKAYIEVNRILIDVQTDQDLQAAKSLGEQFYQPYRTGILKLKSINTILKQCQNYHQLSIGMQKTEFDSTYFNRIDHMYGVENCLNYEKVIEHILFLLLQLQQYSICENILKTLPNCILGKYFKGILHERRKQIMQAKTQYKNVLSIDPYHVEALTNLAIIQIQTDNLKNAHYYLQLASKFSNSSHICYAKGMLFSKKNKIKEAHLEFLKQNQQCWAKQLPDLIYYY